METTLNIRSDISEKIFLAARSRGISRSEMIVVLIKKVMDDIQIPFVWGGWCRFALP
jgi:hypothetical protein